MELLQTDDGLEGEDNELELLECCSEPLRRDHHTHFASKRASVSEAKVLKEIQQLSVMAKNKTVNRAKLHSLKQGKEEPVREFVGRVHSLASTCGYNLSRTGCKMTCSYVDEVIMDQIISRLADLRIQKGILSKPDETDLNSLLCMLKERNLEALLWIQDLLKAATL